MELRGSHLGANGRVVGVCGAGRWRRGRRRGRRRRASRGGRWVGARWVDANGDGQLDALDDAPLTGEVGVASVLVLARASVKLGAARRYAAALPRHDAWVRQDPTTTDRTRALAVAHRGSEDPSNFDERVRARQNGPGRIRPVVGSRGAFRRAAPSPFPLALTQISMSIGPWSSWRSDGAIRGAQHHEPFAAIDENPLQFIAFRERSWRGPSTSSPSSPTLPRLHHRPQRSRRPPARPPRRAV